MSEPEINTLRRNLLITACGLSPKEISEITGEPYEAVSCVVNNLRPRVRTRRKIADLLAQKVYEAFGVEPQANA